MIVAMNRFRNEVRRASNAQLAEVAHPIRKLGADADALAFEDTEGAKIRNDEMMLDVTTIANIKCKWRRLKLDHRLGRHGYRHVLPRW